MEQVALPTSPAFLCPQCHQPIKSTDYFCANCGKKIKEVPPATTVMRQALLYLGSIVLPPMGIVWGIKYLKQPDQKSKLIGIVAMVLTVLSFIITTKIALDYVSQINEQVSIQMNQLQGF
ncbi:MAG: zinc ribbon domain-containing protein [Candidatus Woesebacteria bacterium]